MKTKIIEKCPKCESPHTQSDYVPQHDGCISPNDITCKCGLILRWAVPLFKTTASGCILKIKPDSEKAYL